MRKFGRYSEGMTAKALHIKASGETKIVTLPEANSYLTIKELVGGWIDSVGVMDNAIMYVHDEGLLIEDMEPNPYATFISGQVIFGDVVIVGSLNAKGEYDGENHDVPAEIVASAVEKAPRMNTHEDFRQRVIAGRDHIMKDPIKVYAQGTDGEWERV